MNLSNTWQQAAQIKRSHENLKHVKVALSWRQIGRKEKWHFDHLAQFKIGNFCLNDRNKPNPQLFRTSVTLPIIWIFKRHSKEGLFFQRGLYKNKYTLKSVTIINNNCFESCDKKTFVSFSISLMVCWNPLQIKKVTLARPNVAAVFLYKTGFSILRFPLDLSVYLHP